MSIEVDALPQYTTGWAIEMLDFIHMQCFISPMGIVTFSARKISSLVQF